MLTPILGAAAAITVIGGAIALLVRSGRLAVGWWRPKPPLIALTHPEERNGPFAFFVGGSDAEWERQKQQHETIRLKHLTIEYTIENKGSEAVRELTTGVLTADGAARYTHEPFVVQILAGGDHVEIDDFEPPPALWEGMTDKNRAENFTFWARFRDEHGRRWEATYEPKQRQMDYRVLRRSRSTSA